MAQKTTNTRKRLCIVLCLVFLPLAGTLATAADNDRPRARDVGLVVGIFPPGPLNAITDVAGVEVGHVTVIEGDDVRTGVTAIIPAPGNLYTNPIPAAVHVGNGYGKLTGVTQVRELGKIETPITSSRVLPDALGSYTVGVLVQTNFGGTLTMNGAPVGRELDSYAFKGLMDETAATGDDGKPDGSIMMVVATDAPLYSRNLERVAMRAIMGLARTGSFASNGSGDYVIAFSTNPDVRGPRSSDEPVRSETLVNESMSPLFAATAEAAEEAIYNAIFKATTVESSRGTLQAVPVDAVVTILEKYNVLHWDETLPPGSP